MMKNKLTWKLLITSFVFAIIISMLFIFIPIIKYVFNKWFMIAFILITCFILLGAAIILYINQKEESRNPSKIEKSFRVVAEYWQVILIALLVVEVIFGFIAFPATIQQSSMMPTLTENEHVLVVKKNKIENNDIVVFDFDPTIQNSSAHVSDGELLIKRVIAIPGQSFEYRGVDLYINGEKSIDSFAVLKMDGLSLEDICKLNNESQDLQNKCLQPNGSYIIPDGWYVVFGDNRQYMGSVPLSIDSRSFGLVHESQLMGVVKYTFTGIFNFNKVE